MPSKFVQQMLEMGVSRVSYGSYWYGDETQDEYRIEDAQGNELNLPLTWREALEQLARPQMWTTIHPTRGWQTWDLERNMILSTGELEDHNDSGHRLDKLFEDPALLFELASSPLERGTQYFAAFLHHPDRLVRLAVARNTNLDAATLEPMLCDLDDGVLEVLLLHPRSRALIERHQQMIEDAETARDPHQLPRDVRVLSHSVWWSVRAAVARNPSTPSDVLERLKHDPHEAVKLALTCQPHWTDDGRTTLLGPWLEHPNPERLLSYPVVPMALLEHCKITHAMEVALHPCTPASLQLEILGGVWFYWREREERALLGAPEAARAAAQRLGPEAIEEFIKACVRARGDLHPTEESELCQSPWPRVRAELALNPKVSAEVLDRLKQDADQAVAKAACSRNASPRSARPIHEQWHLFHQIQLVVSNMRTFQHIVWQKGVEVEPVPGLHFQFDLAFDELFDGRALAPEVCLALWERFGAPVVPHLLALKSLDVGLRLTLESWLEDHPAWQTVFGSSVGFKTQEKLCRSALTLE